jgi:hypothetical protein
LRFSSSPVNRDPARSHAITTQKGKSRYPTAQ